MKETISGCIKDLREKKKGVCVYEEGEVFFLSRRKVIESFLFLAKTNRRMS